MTSSKSLDLTGHTTLSQESVALVPERRRRYSTQEKLELGWKITSVLPVSARAQYINDPTYSDSILDWFVFNYHRIEIEGDSMRSKIAYGAIEHR